jgi:hypothetical protein
MINCGFWSHIDHNRQLINLKGARVGNFFPDPVSPGR